MNTTIKVNVVSEKLQDVEALAIEKANSFMTGFFVKVESVQATEREDGLFDCEVTLSATSSEELQQTSAVPPPISLADMKLDPLMFGQTGSLPDVPPEIAKVEGLENLYRRWQQGEDLGGS